MSRFTRGILGRKPLITDANFSDVFSLDVQYTGQITGVWPSTTASTGVVVPVDLGSSGFPFKVFRKATNGRWYPDMDPDTTDATYGTGISTIAADAGGNYILTNTSKSAVAPTLLFKRVTNYYTDYQYKGQAIPSLTALATGDMALSGNTLAVGYRKTVTTSADVLKLYTRSGDTFTLLTSLYPSTGGSGTGVYSVDWSKDGTMLAVAMTISPYVVIYSFNGSTLTQMTFSGTAASTGRFIRFSPDGNYLAYTLTASPYIRIYKRSGTTWNDLTTLTPAGTGTFGGSAAFPSWSPNGNLLSFADISGTGATGNSFFSRSGDSFGAISFPTVYPDSSVSGGGNANAFLFVSDSEILAMNDGWVECWDVNGTTISRPTTDRWSIQPRVNNALTYQGAPRFTGFAAGNSNAGAGIAANQVPVKL